MAITAAHVARSPRIRLGMVGGGRDAFIRNTGITYPSLDDSGATQILRFKAGLGPKSMPAVAFIDTEGRVAAIVLGEIRRQTLYGVIEDIAP